LNESDVVNLVGTTTSTSLHDPQPLKGGITPFSIIYFMPFYEDYIQMPLFSNTPKWESQNWDSCHPKIFDTYIFSI